MGEELQRIKKVKVTEEVFEQIKKNILSKSWPPGHRLPSESKLADIFGVSRVSIRSALQKLATLELIEIRNGEGAFVQEVKPASLLNPLADQITFEQTDIVELMEFRQGVEQIACRFAAERGTEEQLKQLRAILDEMAAYEKQGDAHNYSIADIEFHSCIAAMSQNSMVIKVMEILKDFIFEHVKMVNTKLGMHYTYHKKIYLALEAHNTQEAERLMLEKLNSTVQSIRDA